MNADKQLDLRPLT